MPQLVVFYCMSCCWFIIVCCRPCWGEALLPWKKAVFESFWIRVLHKETIFAFLWMELLPFAKSCPGSAARFLLHTFLLVYNCVLYSLLGGSLAAFKTSYFWKLLDKRFKSRNHLCFSLNAIATFSKNRCASAGDFLLHVLLLVYNCLL